jgi:hypothetical protein
MSFEFQPRKTKPTKILLRGGDCVEEGQAADAITPGMLVKMDANGNYIPHNLAAGNAEKMWATEDALQGKTIEDDYAADDRVFLVCTEPGDIIYAILQDGQKVTPADFLTSAGDGTLKKASGANVVVGVPLESLDLSGTESSGSSPRIAVRSI